MSSTTQPTKPENNPFVQQIIKEVLAQIGKQIKPEVLIPALFSAFMGLFGKKPKKPTLEPTADPNPATLPVGTPVPIPAPSASTPLPGQVARKIMSVGLALQKAERPNMSTPERLQDPGNLYDRPMAMIAAGENFNYGSAFWFDLTAYDENGDEWTGDSIIAADKEFKTEHRIMDEAGNLLAYIKGEGDDNPVAQGEPKPWHQMNGDEITIAQRAWKDSVGRNMRVRIGREGTFKVVGFVDGVRSNELTVKVS